MRSEISSNKIVGSWRKILKESICIPEIKKIAGKNFDKTSEMDNKIFEQVILTPHLDEKSKIIIPMSPYK